MRISCALWLTLGLGATAAGWAPDADAHPLADPQLATKQGSIARSDPRAKPASKGTRKSAKQASKRSNTNRASRPKPRPRQPGSKPGEPDEAARRQLTGDYSPKPNESPELRAMRELDEQLFPRSRPGVPPWTVTLPTERSGPLVDASGLPASPARAVSTPVPPPKDLAWLSNLKLPAIPVRWDPAVVRYLEYYRDHPRGRQLVARWIQRSGRFRDAITQLLRQYQMPEDVLWLALVESAFNPQAYSWAGAAGLWQFMPATGRIYGLTVTRQVDERLDPERSTHAALRHLSDLYQRFGSWDLAFAAYNMGYGGLLASIRKYNTNDYWELRQLEAALPYETSLYVPKIIAIAVVAHNCDVFGCDSVKLDPPEAFEPVAVGEGVTLGAIAQAAGEPVETIAELNPQLLGSRTPPLQQSTTPRKSWTAYVPASKGAEVQKKLPLTRARTRATHRVRWGESLRALAQRFGTSDRSIERLNDLHRGESPRPGTVIFVPSASPSPDPAEPLVVVVPQHDLSFVDKRRVFYEVVQGDTPADIAQVCGVGLDDLIRWNHLDRGAVLQEGMILQVFLPPEARPAEVVLYEQPDCTVMAVGSDEFFRHHETLKGRHRLEVVVREGDTWKELGKRYRLSLGMLERINHRSRKSTLHPGEKVVVYAPRTPSSPTAEAEEPPADEQDDASGGV